MFTQTIWKVEPINASWHPAIRTRCTLCSANGVQEAPHDKFFHAGKHWRGTVEMGMRWARDFQLKHHPTCPTLSAQYSGIDAAEKQLAESHNKLYLLTEAVSQSERALDRAYLAKLHWQKLSHVQQTLDAAYAALAQGRIRLAPEIARLGGNLAATQAALENARAEFVPENTLAEFEAAMAKYLPTADASEPTAPGQQRINGHLVEVF